LIKRHDKIRKIDASHVKNALFFLDMIYPCGPALPAFSLYTVHVLSKILKYSQ